jgi:hypothetical protein
MIVWEEWRMKRQSLNLTSYLSIFLEGLDERREKVQYMPSLNNKQDRYIRHIKLKCYKTTEKRCYENSNYSPGRSIGETEANF